FQNYFRLYEKIAGMTGTANTSKEEFQKVYDLDVMVMPTNMPMVRVDRSDRVYGTEEAKFRAVAREVAQRHAKGQPVLVGTIAIEKSERLSAMLTREGVPHEVLNAKQHDREAQIVANAGARGAVTISTNMAGRGTDIKLAQGVAELGGLFVLGTERHEARRIDNQLRGRSGRQGDAGESQFFISLEDDIMRIFGGERMKKLFERLNVPEDEPIESSMVSKAVEAAQAKVEGFYFDSRKHVLEYDDVMNKQRDSFYRLRRGLADATTDPSALRTQVTDILTDALVTAVQEARVTAEPDKDLDVVSRDAIQRFINLTDEQWQPIASTLPREAGPELPEETRTALHAFSEQTYDRKLGELPEGVFSDVARALFLQTLDLLWTDHLDTMEYLRTGIGLRGYGQRDPLVEYRQESHRLFKNLLARFNNEAATAFFHVTIHAQGTGDRGQGTVTPIPQPEKLIVSHPTAPAPTGVIGQEVDVLGNGEQGTGNRDAAHSVSVLAGVPAPIGNKKPAIGRNDPCYCGSGKKFKKCHGK
ncbi:MAG: preprotein translocase subunit SecA, partial [Parcubacteria group bacterium Gr01-1014_106]